MLIHAKPYPLIPVKDYLTNHDSKIILRPDSDLLFLCPDIVSGFIS